MTRHQAWDGFMWCVLASCVALGLAAATGCSDDGGNAPITDDDPFGIGGDEDTSGTEEHPKDTLGIEFREETDEPRTPIEGERSHLFGVGGIDPENIDKGATSMLMGWGVKGVLHYQDGTCTESDCAAQPDHCSYFGLTCDNAWHSQARTLDFAGEAKFIADFTGACAAGGVATDAWEPCLMPKIGSTAAARKFKYRLDMSTCPQTAAYAAQRTAMINGWASVKAMTADTTGNPIKGIGITWQEVTDNSWDILVKCQEWPGGTALAEWYPNDSLTSLKYAVAVAGGPNHWVDTCTTTGLPGYNANPNLANKGIQDQDMVYQYDRAVVAVDMKEMAATGNNCTTDVNRLMWSYHNVMLHELGHHFGLQHDVLANLDFAVMYGASTCAENTNRKMNFHPFYREALRSLDTTTTSASLTVWDDDIACFIPDEY